MHEEQHHKPKRKWHRDWRTWTVVVLMLLAITAYVLSIDDSLVPAVSPQNDPATSPVR